MATIVVEDGTGKTNSNSYATAAELATYVGDRGVTIAGTDTILLIQAMDYIEQQNFKGEKGSDAQALQWPRIGVYIDNYSVSSTTIPQLLKDAQMEAVIAVDGGNNPLANEARATKRTKVDVIEVEYTDNASDTIYLKAVANKLAKLLKYNGGFRAFRV